MAVAPRWPSLFAYRGRAHSLAEGAAVHRELDPGTLAENLVPHARDAGGSEWPDALHRVEVEDVAESVLQAGARGGAFNLSTDALTIARGLVALEDGLGLQVVIGHPAIDSNAAEGILLRYAETATGASLSAVKRPESPAE